MCKNTAVGIAPNWCRPTHKSHRMSPPRLMTPRPPDITPPTNLMARLNHPAFLLPALITTLTACGGGSQESTTTDTAATESSAGDVVQAQAAVTSATNRQAGVGAPFTLQIASGTGRARFALISGAPAGMTINPVTGRIHWTPTPDQGGRTHTVKAQITPTGTPPLPSSVVTLNISVPSSTPALANAYFIAPNGSNTTGDGSWSKPYADTKLLCDNADATKNIPAGSTIYYRGGTYYNPGYGTGVNPASIRDITCSGTLAAPITVRPWGNERPKIKFDGFNGIKISGSFVTFQSFEIEGNAADIRFDQAMADWWYGNRYFNGNGLVVTGAGVTVADNIVHDVPAAGIDTEPGADLVQFTGNIVFNTSWWSTKGTTAFGLVSLNKVPAARSAGNADAVITVRNNLAFANESRIFSRIMSKGYANLTIDEGSALLIQANSGNYDRGYLIEHNAFLHNGKGASLRADKITFRRNTLYLNGTTMLSLGAGIRSNSGTRLTIENNAVEVRSDKNAIDFSTDTTLLGCSGNLLAGPASNPGLCGDTVTNTWLASGVGILANPTAGNYRVDSSRYPGTYGIDPTVLSALQARLADYGYSIAATGYQVNPEQMRKTIMASVPTGGTLVQQDATTWWVNFPDTTNPTGTTSFKLFW